jgi:ornithine cyclodeaminase/alanine dehydrogenase-like protein (mu-crystallin family)
VIRYLSEAEVETARPTVADGIELARRALISLAEGRAELPPKPSVHPRPGCFSNIMPAYVDDGDHGDALGLKWVSVYATNPERGLPLITGIVLICDTDTGLPKTIMAAAYLTGIRTAAVSGACMAALAPEAVGHVAMTGAGVQTRTHLEVCEALGHLDVAVFARRPESGRALTEWAAEHTPAVHVQICPTAAEAVEGAGIVVTGVPIGTPDALIDPALFRDDALVLPLDFGTSIPAAAIGDHLYADDVGQYGRLHEAGHFPGWREVDGFVGDALRRPRPPGRIVCQNPGQGAADLLFAEAIAERAKALGAGVMLER